MCVCVFGEFFDDHFATFPSLALSLSLLVIFKGGSFGPAVQRSIILTAPAARAAFLTSCYKFVFFFFFSKEVEEVVACVCVCKQTTAVDVERTVLVKKVPGQQNKKNDFAFDGQMRAMFDGWLRISCSIANSSYAIALFIFYFFFKLAPQSCHPCHSG